jgi:hypothetical protein
MQPSSLGDLAVGFWVAREGAFENALIDEREIVALDLLLELFESATETSVAVSKTTIMINANLALLID